MFAAGAVYAHGSLHVNYARTSYGVLIMLVGISLVAKLQFFLYMSLEVFVAARSGDFVSVLQFTGTPSPRTSSPW
jgi:hypothetical protein